MTAYLELVIRVPEEQQDFLIYPLNELGFTGFEEERDVLKAYVPEKSFAKERFDQILSSIFGTDCPVYSINELDDINWNAKWEASFKPVIFDDQVIIRSSFHQPSSKYPYDIIIDPRMSFGTGHHQTTEMMIRMLLEVEFTDHTVLDFGTGTGVLAIMAEMRGAGMINAIDIDPQSVENASENCDLNGCKKITVIEGDISYFRGSNVKFDIILANITRNVIIKSLSDVEQLLEENGTLIVSGFFHSDLDLIQKEASKYHLRLKKKIEKDSWAAAQFDKKQESK